jgi:signal peptidase I
MEFIKRALAAFFDFLQGIVIILALMVMVYLFIMSPQEISGSSMVPTFLNAEYILTNKVEYKFHLPKRGDVVVFKSPKNKDVDYIKRVIGLPGETVKLENGKFYVNGNIVEEPYLDPELYTSGEGFLTEGDETVVPPNYYFVAGDNRPHSMDSRDFGPIPLDDFIGKALLRYFPFDRFWIVPSVNYGF